MASALSAGFSCHYNSVDAKLCGPLPGQVQLRRDSVRAAPSRFELTNDHQWPRNVQYGHYAGIISLNWSQVGVETLMHCDQPSRNRLMCCYIVGL